MFRILAIVVLLVAAPHAIAGETGAFASRALRGVFVTYDLNRDGSVTPEEWARFAQDQADLPIDADGDGKLSETEFFESVRMARPADRGEGLSCFGPEIAAGRELLGRGQPEQAVRALTPATEHAGMSEPVLLSVDAYETMGQSSPAAGLLTRAVEALPNSSPLWSRLARVQEGRGLLSEARAARDRARALDVFARLVPPRCGPETSLAKLWGWMFAIRQKLWDVDPKGALALAVAAVHSNGSDPARRIVLAALHLSRGDLSSAHAEIEAARGLGAPSGLVTALQVARLLDLGDLGGAHRLFGEARPDDFTRAEQFEMAWQLLLRHHTGAAFPWLLSLSWDTRNFPCSGLLASLAFYLDGARAPAVQQLEEVSEARRLEPEEMVLMTRLGRALDRLPRVIELLEDAATVRREGAPWLALARARALAHDDPGQLQALHKCLECEPEGTAIRRQLQSDLDSLGSLAIRR